MKHSKEKVFVWIKKKGETSFHWHKHLNFLLLSQNLLWLFLHVDKRQAHKSRSDYIVCFLCKKNTGSIIERADWIFRKSRVNFKLQIILSKFEMEQWKAPQVIQPKQNKYKTLKSEKKINNNKLFVFKWSTNVCLLCWNQSIQRLKSICFYLTFILYRLRIYKQTVLQVKSKRKEKKY